MYIERSDLQRKKANKEITILIVEDNSYVRNLVCSILKKHEYNLVVATNGAEAINKLNIYGAKIIDLIITDYQMPQMNGLEFMNEIRQ
ncbi:response regulator [Candidatus Bandiella euplotis]|uniref:Response regulator N-terminal domain protein n=1 Tax=Candidatus Bandiella euplotis TaxID=1664265 RepID=A0ABZ0UJJ8_9RICK|nr:response regulator [Candidatus Bandiella woodruffii]WPX96276.1 Putative response regulator N-terminal domain protein [Candidatus Bandiella woodruffii]